MKEFWVLWSISILLVVVLVGVLIFDYREFADRCERLGGVLITNEVCVEPGTDVYGVRD